MGIAFLIIIAIIKYYINKSVFEGNFVEYENIEISVQIMLGQIIGIVLIIIGFILYVINTIFSGIKYYKRNN